MRPDQDLKQHWVCEHCEKPAIGVSPPDECPHCGHAYFENLHDMVQEKGQVVLGSSNVCDSNPS